MHTFDVHMTPALTRRAWNTWFFARGSHWKLAAAMVIFLAGAWVQTHGGDFAKHPPSNVTIVALTVGGLFGVFYILGYIFGLRDSLAQHAREIDGRCTYTLTADTISLTNSEASATVPWGTIAEFLRSGDFLRFKYRNGIAFSTPLAQIPPEALAFLLERARANGVKVTGL